MQGSQVSLRVPARAAVCDEISLDVLSLGNAIATLSYLNLMIDVAVSPPIAAKTMLTNSASQL